ncbi:MAG: hypothetical protein ABWY50_01670 [Aeromicrobium sp.]
MLTTTTARRTVAVLMAALVAVLLVATGGTARASDTTDDAGTSHASRGHHAVRHAAVPVPQSHDRHGTHLDLASTPPTTHAHVAAVVSYVVDRVDVVRPGNDTVTPVGRAPPAL